MAKAGVIDAIKANLPPANCHSWEYRVDPKHAGTLKEIKDAWKRGEFGSRRITAARAIAKFLNGQGISQIGTQGVLQWLAKE